MKVKQIIKAFFKEKLEINGTYLMANHIVETILPKYGTERFNITHSPGTYSRVWRDIREKSLVTEDTKVMWQNFKISEISVMKSAEKYFRIEKVE